MSHGWLAEQYVADLNLTAIIGPECESLERERTERIIVAVTRATPSKSAVTATETRRARRQRGRASCARLKPEEREQLDTGLDAGRFPKQAITRIRIVLLLDLGITVDEVARLVRVTPDTIAKWNREFLLSGLEGLLRPRKPSPRRKYAQDIDAQILAIAREAPPTGQRWWTAKLIAARLGGVPHKFVSRVIKLARFDLRAGRRRAYRY